MEKPRLGPPDLGVRLAGAEEQGDGEGLVGPRLPVGKGEFEADQFEADQHVLRPKHHVESVSEHSLDVFISICASLQCIIRVRIQPGSAAVFGGMESGRRRLGGVIMAGSLQERATRQERTTRKQAAQGRVASGQADPERTEKERTEKERPQAPASGAHVVTPPDVLPMSECRRTGWKVRSWIARS